MIQWYEDETTGGESATIPFIAKYEVRKDSPGAWATSFSAWEGNEDEKKVGLSSSKAGAKVLANNHLRKTLSGVWGKYGDRLSWVRLTFSLDVLHTKFGFYSLVKTLSDEILAVWTPKAGDLEILGRFDSRYKAKNYSDQHFEVTVRGQVSLLHILQEAFASGQKIEGLFALVEVGCDKKPCYFELQYETFCGRDTIRMKGDDKGMLSFDGLTEDGTRYEILDAYKEVKRIITKRVG